MNDSLTTQEEQDDAAFRARLAPLASEVLPSQPLFPAAPVTRGRRDGIAMFAVVGVIAVFGVAALLANLNGTSLPGDSREVARGDPPVVGAAAGIEPRPPAEAPKVKTPTDDMIALLLQRGHAASAYGDITGARLLFERAAALGSPAAATEAGKTYDVEYLLSIGARGIRADQAAAAAWYRRAAALGNAEARERLTRIERQPTR
jgi:hypothetical protein